MSFLFLMDPYLSLNLATETSLLLMEELLKRGCQVFWLEQEDIFLNKDRPYGRVDKVKSVSPLVKEAAGEVCLNEFNALLNRLDPPFDGNYLHTGYILDHLSDKVVQFNPSKAVRNFNEKILPLKWPMFVPPSLVSQNVEQLLAFLRQHKEIVIKPLDDCSGRGVVKISVDEDELGRKLNTCLIDAHGQKRFVQAQKFLPQVKQGDKRVYLVNGEVVGLVNRIPQEGNYLANIHQGAECQPAKLSMRERIILKEVAPFLIEQELFLVGIDFIDGFITEINVTSPSAVRQINQVMAEKIQVKIVDAMIERLEQRNNKASLIFYHCC